MLMRSVQKLTLPCYHGQSSHRPTALSELLIAQIRRLRVAYTVNLGPLMM